MDVRIQIIKLGSEIVKQYYQNKQFQKISEQNQMLLDTVREYRMLSFVDKFHAAMTLLEEAYRSQNDTVFHRNLHSANERFTEVLCMQRPEGINDNVYRNIIVATYFGKFQYYSAFEDVPNMMMQFFACGTRYPLEAMECFSKEFPQLFANDRFVQYLDEGTWEPLVVNRYKKLLEAGAVERSAIRDAARWVKDIGLRMAQREAVGAIPASSNFGLLYALYGNNPAIMARNMVEVQHLKKASLFCEEPETIILIYANRNICKWELPQCVELVENYMTRKISLLKYYEDGLKELEGG